MMLRNLTLLLISWALISEATELPSQTDESLFKEVARVQKRGLAWLVTQQETNGSWRSHPAITALATSSLLHNKTSLSANHQTAAENGLKFILKNVKPSGAIFGGGDTDRYPNYSTAICSMALLASGNPDYHDTIRDARAFLLSTQFDESEGITQTNASYGGIGYGRRQRPDLSNTQWALEALRLTERFEKQGDPSPREHWNLHWQKAAKFLQRCQNLPNHNDQAWAVHAEDRDIGGFVYMPGFSFANEGEVADTKTPLHSYGSMSYAGLKSYIYAELKKDDPRVVAAMNWIKHNYTLDENPGLGSQGLYYYYHVFAKALTAFGEDTITDGNGKTHDWRHELMRKLVTLQKHEGYWINENNRWWENDPVLVTSYNLLALHVLMERRYP